MIRFAVPILATLLFPMLVFGGNSHEHFQLLPTANNFLIAAPQIFALDHSSQKLSALFTNAEILVSVLRESNFQDAQIAKVLTAHAFQELTLSELCSQLGGDSNRNLEKLLAIQNKFISDKALAKQVFVAIESLRRSLILLLDTPTVVAIFRDYLIHEPLIDRDEIEMTVSSVYFGGDQVGKLQKIKEIAKSYGSQVEYLYSIRRPQLEGFNFQSLESLNHFFNSGLIMGIDLTGSMYEKTERKPLSYDDALRQLFNFASQKKILLKIHSFEDDNTGPFYEAFSRVFSHYNKPLKIRIGHINKLTKHWLEILSSNAFVDVSLDASLESNLFLLEESSIAKIVQIIEEAKRFGLPVYLGSDGRGMLEGSSYSEQKRTLESFSCAQLLKSDSTKVLRDHEIIEPADHSI